VADDGEFEEGAAEYATGTSRKAKNKSKTIATPKRKSDRSGKSRAADSDDEVTVDATAKDSEVVLADSELVSDPPVAQQSSNANEIPPPQDAQMGLNFLIGSEIVLTCDFQEDQENTPLPPRSVKSNQIVVQPSVSRKTAVPASAPSFSRFNYSHSLASEEKPTSMAEIIRRANSAAGTPSVKPYLSFTKASRSVFKRIAPLHTHRKTPPPKKTKKQLELEEKWEDKWEEELEETVEGWVALSSQEREELRKQKRDMEMVLED
jgi:hypothetical protein